MASRLADIESRGVLLVSDARLPSLASRVAGEPVHGSWWASRDSQKISRVLSELSSHPDVLLVKLIAGKNTLVHRRVWPQLAAIALSGEPWQFQNLSKPARRLYDRVLREGELEATGALTLELETRLLVRSRQVHGQELHGGAHRKHLEDWRRWAASAGVNFSAIDIGAAKTALQALCPEARFAWA
jgi:hypothetical protein